MTVADSDVGVRTNYAFSRISLCQSFVMRISVTTSNSVSAAVGIELTSLYTSLQPLSFTRRTVANDNALNTDSKEDFSKDDSEALTAISRILKILSNTYKIE